MIALFSEDSPPFQAIRAQVLRLVQELEKYVTINKGQASTRSMIEEITEARFVDWGIFSMKRDHRRKVTEAVIYLEIASMLGKPFDEQWVYPKILQKGLTETGGKDQKLGAARSVRLSTAAYNLLKSEGVIPSNPNKPSQKKMTK